MARSTSKAKGSHVTVDGRPLRAVLYLRQSLDQGGDEMAVSRQEEACRAYCTAKGWTVVEVYRENDTSASGRKARPKFDAMLDDGAAGAFDVIVSTFLDRLTRTVRDLLPLIDLYRRHGVATATVRDGIDLTTDVGELVATILAAVANLEIRRKGERQKMANEQLADEGHPSMGGAAPFGFRDDWVLVGGKERRRRTVDAVTSASVRKAYESLLAGRSVSSIARDLNEAGHATMRGKEWTHRSVRGLLLAPRNAGLRVHRGVIVGAAAWGSIVDEPTWRAAKAILDDPARRTTPRDGGTRKHLGVSLFQCGVCADGATMETETGGGKDRKPARQYGCKTGKHLRRLAEPIDRYVVNAIVDRMSRADAASVLVDHDRPNLGALQAEATDLRTRLDDLAAAFGEGEITRAQLRTGSATLRSRLTEVEAAMVHSDRAIVLGDLVAAKDKRAAWNSFDLDRQRAIINALCRVTILRGRRGGNSRLSGTERPFRDDTIVVDFHV